MSDQLGTLYVVATPIGNMSDLSRRAAEILRSCDVVACEDTRVTGGLLRRLDVSKKMFVNEDSRERAAASAILEMLESGKNVALVSDAGTPCISDPGFRAVRACRAAGVNVVPVPGACAFVAALSASGLPTDSFMFAGFLPAKSSARKNFFEKYRDFGHTLVFYESPYRIGKFLRDAVEIFGSGRTVCVAKEITKVFERFFVGKLSDVADGIESSPARGEFVVIIAPDGYEL